MKLSIIIRTYNEQKHIGKVLSKLTNQSMKNFEVIIVDSDSIDRTLKIVSKFKTLLNIKVFHINPNLFSYPKACNIGATNATGIYLCYLSGHSIPRYDNFLEKGVGLFDLFDKLAGVYGPTLPHKNSSLTEKIFYSFGYFQNTNKIVNKPKMGILGNTNSIIPKTLWEKHHFDEKYVYGGEDYHWAKYFLNKNYLIIKSPSLSVYHSHRLGLIKFIKQFIIWYKSMSAVGQ